MSRANLYVAGQFLLFGVLAVALLVFPTDQYPLPRIIGLALIVVGFVVIALAIREFALRNRTLPNVTPTPTAHVDLVQTGIYAHIRHPIYAGVLFGALGVALAHGHVVVMVVALVIIVFFTFKSRYEETLLTAIYPQYPAYRSRSGRFLPFV
jgi:protein-S-isoprenylcysteine O-methyltransferase Ste14